MHVIMIVDEWAFAGCPPSYCAAACYILGQLCLAGTLAWCCGFSGGWWALGRRDCELTGLWASRPDMPRVSGLRGW